MTVLPELYDLYNDIGCCLESFMHSELTQFSPTRVRRGQSFTIHPGYRVIYSELLNRTYANLENELIYPQSSSSIRMVYEGINKQISETHPCGLLSTSAQHTDQLYIH